MAPLRRTAGPRDVPRAQATRRGPAAAAKAAGPPPAVPAALRGAPLGVAAALVLAAAPVQPEAATGVSAPALVQPAHARRLEGVNKPELLPKERGVVVIDVAGFLSDGQEQRLTSLINGIEKDTGVKLRLLTQNYPDTPGLAIKDYWGVDEDTVVFVADPSFGKSGGNILNFNIGTNVDLNIPPNFWSRLSGKYGTTFYWQENGEDAAIENAVSAIATCAREPPGKLQCSTVQGAFGEADSAGKWSDFFAQKS